MYLEIFQASKMELFAKIAIDWKLWTIFTNSVTLDVWQSAENVSVCGLYILLRILHSLRKKWSFPLRISSVNVTKSKLVKIGHIYWRNP